VPIQAKASFNSGDRTAVLSWKPGNGGTRIARFRIYGSRERGFTPSKKPYVVDAGLDGPKNTPSNLLYETVDSTTSWEIPPQLWRAYYRISAVDSEGRESGTSEMIELQHPLIKTQKLPQAKAGSFYQTQIDVSSSIGHLVSQNENGKAYQMRFRSGDELFFSLSGAPEKLSIRKEDGLIAGYLPASSNGKFQLKVTVTDSRSGNRDEELFELEVRK
jgi:hypothetical protein